MTELRDVAAAEGPVPRPPRPGARREAGPVVATTTNEIDAFPLAIDRDVRHMALQDGNWIVDTVPLGGPALAPPAALTRGPGEIELFMLGADSALHYKRRGHDTKGEWEPPGTEWVPLGTPPGRIFVDRPQPAALSDDGADVFALASDGRTYQRVVIPGHETEWLRVGSNPIPESRWAPRVVPMGGAAELFVTSIDSRVWRARVRSGDPDTSWEDLGCPLQEDSTARPGGVFNTNGGLEVYMHGRNLGSYRRRAVDPAEPYGPWEEVIGGGNVRMALDGMAFEASGHTFDTVIVDRTSRLHHVWGEDGGFGWRGLGTPASNVHLLGQPYAVCPDYDRMDVLVLGTDTHIYQRTYRRDGLSGANWDDEWVRLPLGEIIAF